MPEPTAPPRWFIAALAVALLIVSGWLVSHLYSTPSSPGCEERYAKARTSAETLAVDRQTPEHDPFASGAMSCAEVRRNSHPGGAQQLLARAIAAAGGETALAALPAIEWSGSATIHTPGRDIDILGTWRIAPPDTARVTTWLAAEDSSQGRTMVVAGPAGWLVRNDKSEPMPADQLVEEQHQFYLYSLLRLLPLRDSAVTLTSLPADSTGQQGVLVHRPGRLDVALYFDFEGRVRRMRTRFAAPPGSPGADEDVRLEGTAAVAGVHWFRQMHILKDGEPYFDLVVLEAHQASTPPANWVPGGQH